MSTFCGSLMTELCCASACRKPCSDSPSSKLLPCCSISTSPGSSMTGDSEIASCRRLSRARRSRRWNAFGSSPSGACWRSCRPPVGPGASRSLVSASASERVMSPSAASSVKSPVSVSGRLTSPLATFGFPPAGPWSGNGPWFGFWFTLSSTGVVGSSTRLLPATSLFASASSTCSCVLCWFASGRVAADVVSLVFCAVGAVEVALTPPPPPSSSFALVCRFALCCCSRISSAVRVAWSRARSKVERTPSTTRSRRSPPSLPPPPPPPPPSLSLPLVASPGSPGAGPPILAPTPSSAMSMHLVSNHITDMSLSTRIGFGRPCQRPREGVRCRFRLTTPVCGGRGAHRYPGCPQSGPR